MVAAGHNQSIHDYSDVEYPGDLRNCDACHDTDDTRAHAYTNTAFFDDLFGEPAQPAMLMARALQ
jgi:hypothetical protein